MGDAEGKWPIGSTTLRAFNVGLEVGRVDGLLWQLEGGKQAHGAGWQAESPNAT